MSSVSGVTDKESQVLPARSSSVWSLEAIRQFVAYLRQRVIDASNTSTSDTFRCMTAGCARVHLRLNHHGWRKEGSLWIQVLPDLRATLYFSPWKEQNLFVVEEFARTIHMIPTLNNFT
jgi:hypothetical protein